MCTITSWPSLISYIAISDDSSNYNFPPMKMLVITILNGMITLITNWGLKIWYSPNYSMHLLVYSMSNSIPVFMYIFTYSCIPVFLYSCISVFLYSCILYSCIHVFMYSCIPVFLYSCIHVFMYSRIPVFLYSFIPVFLYSCIPVLLYCCISVLLYSCNLVFLYSYIP